jgi:glycosyltransferase involved in cell wall biosynthesis
MGKRLPLVSVLVPTFNGARFLDETLLSIRRQTYRNLQILIRDDCSTDDTLAIARQNAAEDARIQVIEVEENRGGVMNYIALGELAEGEYVKYCNQDDLLEPTCVATFVKQLENNSRISLATSARRLIDADGKGLPGRAYTAPLVEHDSVLAGRDVLRHMALNHLNQIGEPTTAMYRNGAVEPTRMFWFGGHEARVNGDVFLWAHLLMRGDLYYHRAELSSFRIHDQQFSANDATFVFGHIEWVLLLQAAIELDIVAPDAMCVRSAAALLPALDAVAERARVSPDSRVHGHEHEIAAATQVLRELASMPAAS